MSYRKVDQKLWSSPTFRSLSEDARALYQYLLTSPHNNILCCFRLPVLYAADDLQWLPERLREPFKELLAERRSDGTPMIYRDDQGITVVFGQLRKEGLVNDNAVKAGIKTLDSLPSYSPVFQAVLDEVKVLSKQTDKDFHQPLIERLKERLVEPLSNRSVTVPEPRAHVQEQEQEQEHKDSLSPILDDDKISSDPPDKNLELAELLFSLIQENNPKAKTPNFKTWAKDIDLAHRRDNRSYEDLEKIIRWSQADSFWNTNILSPAKLKKQFDQLWVKARRSTTSSTEQKNIQAGINFLNKGGNNGKE